MRVSQTDTGTQIAAQGLSDGAWNGTFNFTITQQIYKVRAKSRHVEQFLKNAGRTVPFKTDFWYTVYRN